MSQKLQKYQPTPEQVARWKRMDELESSAFVGRFPSAEKQRLAVKEFLETDYIESQLEKLRAHRKKLIEKLKSTQEYEEMLLAEKQKRNNK
ncbi:hypothetical protein [Rivularia sp. UHCC 0363]|uniref:hypothetical protein n=1 Tax=Rivularia sp. UHCC 0363 TaxID=3110244 RepID=UPI002B1ED424|nr:hypothetical protein [Rivularia sp. UHCC 0363]MEA5594064.1 hypothetical protein [Rivularia sp. UHCC 0363]